MSDTNRYESELSTRYASEQMSEIFSPGRRAKVWRQLWIALAKAEKELGLDITDSQIAELEAAADTIDFNAVRRREKEVRHDVMAHIYAYGLQCPTAKGIIHLGATSCYVGDNSDLIAMRDGLDLLLRKLLCVMKLLADFALQYKDLPTLGFTHIQSAQVTTVGKRATLWLNDFYEDFKAIARLRDDLPLRGAKGATGTQASFLELFEGDGDKVRALEMMIADQFGFAKVAPVTGQTYSRKIDSDVLFALAQLAQSAYKMAGDIRLLAHMKEVEEPFGGSQIGSSAMPYKRNPMKSERICALARFVMTNVQNALFTAASQNLERTLDDSANKRLSVASGFLASDGILNVLLDVCDGLVVYGKMIDKHLRDELPFMASEAILMQGVKNGGDRQVLHGKLREHSLAAAAVVKGEGLPNDLPARIVSDGSFGIDEAAMTALLDARNFVGMAPEQTERFVAEHITPLIKQHPDWLGEKAQLTV